MSKKDPTAMLMIGATKPAMDSLAKTILAILSAPHADEATKQEALRTLSRGAEVNNTSVMNCSFNGGGSAR